MEASVGWSGPSVTESAAGEEKKTRHQANPPVACRESFRSYCILGKKEKIPQKKKKKIPPREEMGVSEIVRSFEGRKNCVEEGGGEKNRGKKRIVFLNDFGPG